MNNNVNMGAMGGPVGGMPMMNNGVPRGNPRAMPVNDNQQRSQLNTYIYEYFLRNEMYDCARSIISSGQPINVMKNSPSGRDANGLENGDDGQDGDSKDDMDAKRPNDLPAPNLPKECPESCFLYEWWCLFWDMFNAQRGKGDTPNVQQYVTHTQQQSRAKQDHQQQLLRQMRPTDMNPQQFQQMMGMRNSAQALQQNDLAKTAMRNNGQRNVQGNPQQMQQQMMMQAQQQKQGQFQREGSEMEGNRRPGSPKGENAPSPSKRPRLEGAPFNNGQQQPNMMPNGRGQPQGMPDQQQVGGPVNNVQQATQILVANGLDPGNLTPQQMQTLQNAAMQSGQPGKAQSLQAYTSNLVQHQANQMPNKGMQMPNGPQNQGSPMMSQGQDGSAIGAYYNPDGSMGTLQRPGGVPGQPGNGNHALQDYQMQLMLLEQQNKKRLMMARQEQDNLGGSPQGPRSGSSPNPNDMKRGTPQMNAAGIPSPLPDGQSRGSPSSMNFMVGNQMDPNMQRFMGNPMNGMEGQMVGIPAGMRPPSSVPPGFQGQMTPQMIQTMQRQQQVAGGQIPGWQSGPNGTPMMQQTSQGGPQPQSMGTPQQRAMPPPSAPAAAPANGRTQPPSPQQNAAPPTPSQGNKANPKKGKDTKATKKNAKKGAAAGATPAGETAAEPATPTPQTPITPQHNKSFNNNNNNNGGNSNGNAQTGSNQNAVNGQVPATAPAPVLAQPQPDPSQNNMDFGNDMFQMPAGLSMDFANPAMGSGDVLQDFDFDSFLHADNDTDAFNFDAGFALGEGNEVGAE